MKYKKFADEKPTMTADYWYLASDDDKPRIAEWNNDRQKFQGDPDQYGPHTFYDPEYWAEIERPEL